MAANEEAHKLKEMHSQLRLKSMVDDVFGKWETVTRNG
jgi:hypothetical protein